MKTYRELLKTDTYWMMKIQNDLYNAVENYLESNNMTRTQFAAQLGVSKGYISQVLNGEFNHRLSKLIEISLAIGKVPIFEFVDLEEVVEEKLNEENDINPNIQKVPIRKNGTKLVEHEEQM